MIFHEQGRRHGEILANSQARKLSHGIFYLGFLIF